MKSIPFKKHHTRTVGLLALAAVLTGCGGEEPLCLDSIDVAPYDRVEVECTDHAYTLTIPNTCEAGGCGLIMDIHGGSMTANTQNDGSNLSQLGTDAVSMGATTPYIVVQPSADGNIWSESGKDDGFVYDFMQQVVDKFDVDSNRIHFGGFSQGSSMTWRFVCKYADTFASFGPSSGVNPNDPGVVGCDLPRTPILYTHGIDDILANYSEAETLLENMRQTIGAANLEETIIDEGEQHTQIRLTGNGYFFEHISHTSTGLVAGHCMPGGTGWLGCDGSFAYGEKALEFYIAHPKGQ